MVHFKEIKARVFLNLFRNVVDQKLAEGARFERATPCGATVQQTARQTRMPYLPRETAEAVGFEPTEV